MKKELVGKEKDIVNFLKEKSRTISEIKRRFDLDYKNAHRYCRKLYDKGFVDLIPPPTQNSKGKAVQVSLKNVRVQEKKENILSCLQEAKKSGNAVSESILLDKFGMGSDDDWLNFRLAFDELKYEKFMGFSTTKKGEKYLKGNKKK